MKICKLLFPLLFIGVSLQAQQNNRNVWNGKKCAVVITYDDAINQHLDNALPVLDSLGLKATFYVTANGTKDRISDWKNVSTRGHELGNHTLFHPCLGGPGREWVKGENDMNNYTVARMVNEIKMTNIFLEALDGKKKRTFAYTCGDMKIRDTAFMDQLRDDFVAARGVKHSQHKIHEVDLYNTDCYMVNGESASQMIEWVNQAEQNNTLLVILFHGVGGGNSLNVSLESHREFLSYLKKKEKDLWIAPMLDVAEHIKNKQSKAN